MHQALMLHYSRNQAQEQPLARGQQYGTVPSVENARARLEWERYAAIKYASTNQVSRAHVPAYSHLENREKEKPRGVCVCTRAVCLGCFLCVALHVHVQVGAVSSRQII